jgi:outer membrane protein TolC
MVMRRILVFLSLIFSLVNSGALLAEPMPLTLETLYQIAVSRNETIRVQIENIAQSEALYQQTFGTVMPQVHLLATHTLQDTSGVGSGALNPFTAGDQPNYRFNFKQTLFTGFRESAALHALESQIALQRETLAQNKRQLFSQIAAQFMEILRLEREGQNLNDSQKTTLARIEELKTRVRLGKSRSSELLNVQSQLSSFMAQIAQNDQALLSARQALASLAGINENQLALQDKISAAELPPIEKLVEKITSKNEFLILKYQKNYYADQLKVNTGNLWPTIAFQGNYYLKRQPALDPIKWDVALSLDMALFQGGTEWGLISQTESQLRQVDAVYDKTLREQSLQLVQLAGNYQSLLKQHEFYRDAYEQAKKSYQMIKNEYTLGLTNNLEVNQAFAALVENKRHLDANEIQMKLNWVQLKIFFEEMP